MEGKGSQHFLHRSKDRNVMPGTTAEQENTGHNPDTVTHLPILMAYLQVFNSCLTVLILSKMEQNKEAHCLW